MAYQEFIGRVTLPSYDLTVNSVPKSTTAATYFMRGYDSEPTAQLMEHVEAIIQTEYGSATVTYSTTTGKVTIAFGTTGSLSWDDTALRDLLGFDADLTSVTGATAANPMQNIWRPSREVTRFPHYNDMSNLLVPESSTIINISENGTCYTLAGNLVYRVNLNFMYLDISDVITPTSGVDRSFQNLWNNVFHEGQPVRYLPDRTAYTSSDYQELMVVPDGDKLGSFNRFRQRRITEVNNFWDINLDCYKFIQ